MEGGWEKDGSHRPAHRVPPLIGICIRRTHVCRRQRFCFETCGSSAHHATPTRWKCSRCWASLTAMAASSLPPLLSPGAAPLACAAPLGLARAAPLTRGFAAPLTREPRRSSRHSSGDAMLLPSKRHPQTLAIGLAHTRDEHSYTQSEYSHTHRLSAPRTRGPVGAGRREKYRWKALSELYIYISARNHHMHMVSR